VVNNFLRLVNRAIQAGSALSGRIAGTALGFLLFFGTLALSAGEQIGAKIPTFRLTDTDGKVHTLEDYTGKLLVLEFWSFKCPPASTYDDRVKALESKYRNRGAVLLAVSSNKNESVAETRLNRNDRQLPYPVLMDPEGALAENLGATHTPSVVILDGSGILRYRGAIDNNKPPGERDRLAYVEDALDALIAGKPVQVPETRMAGCGIRR